MRFSIKARALSLTEAFVVRDDAGNAVFEIREKFFHIGDDLVMVDSSTGQELIHIKQHVLSLMPLYEIYRNDHLLASIHQQFQLFGEGFTIEVGDDSTLRVAGDILRWNFSVTNDAGHVVAQISRQFSFLDSFAIDATKGVDAPFLVALVIVIEMVRQHHESQHHERVGH
jgi:uncharacterized protein YxjI